MPRMRRLAALALAAAALAPLARAGDPVTLAWKLEKGTVLRYRFSTEQVSVQRSVPPDPAGGEGVQTKQIETIEYRLTVLDRDPASGAARIVCRYEHVAVELEQMMLGRIKWDSKKREDLARGSEPAVRPYARLLGQEFSFLLAPSGAVSDVRGHDKVRAEVLAGLEDSPFAALALGGAFGDEAVRSDLERAFAILPPGPIEPGASFARTFDQPLPLLGTLRYETKTALEKVADGKAHLAFETALAAVGSPAPAAAADPVASKIEIEFKGGKGKGTVVFDAAAGRLERSEGEVRMTLASRLLPPVAPKEGPGAASVVSEVIQRFTIERIPE